MAYTVKDLVTLFRREVDDPTYYMDRNLPQADSFWSNYELIHHLDQGQKEFAEKTLVFKDSTSFKPSITEDDPWVKYDERILKIERAEVDSTETIIPVYTIEEFEHQVYVDDYGIKRISSWESNTGSPQCLISDIKNNSLRLYPIPTEDDSLLLTVRRLPLEDLTVLNDDIELPSRWQHGLLKYLRKEAFKKPTAIAAGFAEIAMLSQRDWDDFISQANSRIYIRTRNAGKVRYGGI